MTGDLRTSAPRQGGGGVGSTLGPALMLVAITAAAFGPVLTHHFIESWDDSPAILINPDYNPPTLGKLAHYWVPPPKNTFYVPVTYSLWGLLAMMSRASAPPHVPFNPAMFYAANLTAHAFSAGLVFLILAQLVPWRLGAWLGAALFALHPVQVEGVATASSVYTPLSSMFGFFATWQFLRFLDAFHDRRAGRPRARRAGWGNYALATVCFLLAVLTKPTAVAVPLVIAVIGVTLRPRKPMVLALTLGPWVAIALAVISLNQHAAPGSTVFLPELQYRPLVPLDAIGFYIVKLFAPVRLVSDYGRSPRWLVDHPAAWLTCLIPIALCAIAWRMRNHLPWLLMGFGVFVAGLLPSIGVVPFDYQHYSTVADRYMYIAMLGPAIAAAFVLERWRGRIVTAIAIAWLGVLTTLSVVQLGYWRDDWRLMAHTLEINPQSVSAANGFNYLLTGWHDDRAFPAPRDCTIDQPALVRAGDLLMQRHLWPIAAAAYRRALTRGNPNAIIYDRLGDALLRNLDPQDAAEAFRQGLRLDASDPDATRGLAEATALLDAAPGNHRAAPSTRRAFPSY